MHACRSTLEDPTSENIPQIVALIDTLIQKGAAYASEGDVYFQVSKFPGYAKLSRQPLDKLRAGERELKTENREQKREPLDFALWKAAKPGEPSWDAPWGRGRPGWHIECSAMAARYLGESFDLHGGGLDLKFPHHENEIAQSEAASGKPMCTCWMHGGFIDLEGAKMSKSLGNVVRLRDALNAVDGESLRYFFMSTHYRNPLDFTDKSLADAEQRVEYFYETLKKVDERLAGKDFGTGPLHGEPAKALVEFEAAMDDDFNFPGGLAALSTLFASMNELTDKPPVKDKSVVGRTLKAQRDIVTKLSSVLGLFEDAPGPWLLRRRDRQVATKKIDLARVESLLAARQAARAAKNFAESDRVRDELKGMGIELRDTPQGQEWKVASA